MKIDCKDVMIVLLCVLLLAACAISARQDTVIEQQRALIKLQMQDSHDLAICRVAAIQAAAKKH